MATSKKTASTARKTRKTTSKTVKETPPWEKKNPKAKSGKHTKLTAAEKQKAKARAEKAGRPYPNLVDNMVVAKEKKQRG